MFKFKDTADSISSQFLLYKQKTTNTSQKDQYTIDVNPSNSILSDGVITFNIPSQSKGMLSEVEIVTKFKIKKGDADLEDTDKCSIINNFANALWELVEVQIGERVDLMQSMRNSYAYTTFLYHALEDDPNREDMLFRTQLFAMDKGKTKKESEELEFSTTGADVTKVKNSAAAKRAGRIKNSTSVTIYSKLRCPLFNNEKSLPSNMKIRVTLHKNLDRFLLMSTDDTCRVYLEDVYLSVTYDRATDVVLSILEEALAREAAPYYISKPEMIIKPIDQDLNVRINNVFPGKLPKHAFMFVQRSQDFSGSFNTNPFAFIPFNKFQFFIDGVPYFNNPLEINYTTSGTTKLYKENASFLRQLYRTVGKDIRGAALINSENFQLNYMVGMSLTPDRCSSKANYLSLQTEASTRLEFDLDQRVATDAILVIIAFYDRLITINKNREVQIIE